MELWIVPCWTCTKRFLTQVEMCAHHLDAHERPLPARACRRFAAAEAPLALPAEGEDTPDAP